MKLFTLMTIFTFCFSAMAQRSVPKPNLAGVINLPKGSNRLLCCHPNGCNGAGYGQCSTNGGGSWYDCPKGDNQCALHGKLSTQQ